MIPLFRRWLFVPFSCFLFCSCSCSSYREEEDSFDSTARDNGINQNDTPSRRSEVSHTLDPRMISLNPSAFHGREADCDVAFVGAFQALRHADQHRYPPSTSHRQTVLCRTQNGEGWADLIFSKETIDLMSSINVGHRIRVRIESSVGFQDYPVIRLISVGEEIDSTIVNAHWLYSSVPAGDRFRTMETKTHRICSILYIGDLEPIFDSSLYPDSSVYRALIACRHVLGETYLDLAFSSDQQANVLSLRPGDSLPLSLHAMEGGRAGYSIATIDEFSM